MKCKICGTQAKFIFSKILLQKYNVKYFKCEKCFFVFTETPYWLEEAYQSAFTKTDTGLLARPLLYGKIIESNLIKHFDSNEQFLDYGGGNGILVRLMRDLGYNFYRYDKFAENIYAIFFDIADLPSESKKFELITALEVFEHIPEPMQTFSEIFNMSETLFLTTYLAPNNDSLLNDWWYISPFHGQHISFFHQKTLNYIALYYNKNLYSNNIECHIITSKNLLDVRFEPGEYFRETGPFRIKNKIIGLINRLYNKTFKPVNLKKNESLTIKDCDYSVLKVNKKLEHDI